MKRILIPVALLLFSAGVYFLFVLPNQIEQKFKDAVPENVEVKYKYFSVNLLDKSVVVDSLQLEDGKQLIEIERLEVIDVSDEKDRGVSSVTSSVFKITRL